MPRRARSLTLWLSLLVLLGFAAMHIAFRPRNDRDWSPDQAVLAWAELDGHIARVHNVRDNRYRTPEDYDVRHEDRSYDLDSLESVWLMVEPITSPGIAHTLVSFGFAGGKYVSVSVEIRKEKGEHFDPLRGLLRQYELMYVVADERDVIALRTNYRRDRVYLYPIRTSRERMRAMFVGMLERANALREHPEFYNTLTSTCTTNIVRHVNEVSPRRISPWHPRVLLPAYADRLAYALGLIDTSLPFEEAQRRYRIDERARAYGDGPDFSRVIRGS
ncbi:MAG TPA: DUF4105 domain-containing protein [Gemmatimonadaceae bacterium]|nr:DUF4105 domain-containing protein [Gemmatimonadaceae bacterium]